MDSRVNVLVSALSAYFGDDRLPPRLGGEVFLIIRKRLRSEGLFDCGHAEEVLSIALTNAVKYLQRHGGEEVRQPRAWLHMLCRRACIDYLKEVATHDLPKLPRPADCELELLDSAAVSEEYALASIHRAIQLLRPRHRWLIFLDIIECQSPNEIQVNMQLASNGAFRKLKHEAFLALREAIARQVWSTRSARSSCRAGAHDIPCPEARLDERSQEVRDEALPRAQRRKQLKPTCQERAEMPIAESLVFAQTEVGRRAPAAVSLAGRPSPVGS